MATEYVDRVFISVDGTMIEADEFGVKMSVDGQEMIKPMTRRNRATGYTGGVITYELNLVVAVPKGGLAVDFRHMLKAGTLFVVLAQYPGGEMDTYVDCKIKDLDMPSRMGEGTKVTLTIDALDDSNN